MSKTERRDHTGLHSNPCSASEMKTLIGSQEHVYGVVEPNIGEDLQNYLHNFVKQALGG